LFPFVLQALPLIVTVVSVTSHLRLTGKAPAFGPTVKKLEFEDEETKRPEEESKASWCSTPPTAAQTLVFGPIVTPPKSTVAATPIEHEDVVETKYASGQDAVKRFTLRARGGFGGAADPALDQPWMNSIPFPLARS
jgi:hypothetical protein